MDPVMADNNLNFDFEMPAAPSLTLDPAAELAEEKPAEPEKPLRYFLKAQSCG